MSHSPQHNKQRYKNYAVLIAVAAVCVLFFALTIVKLKGY